MDESDSSKPVEEAQAVAADTEVNDAKSRADADTVSDTDQPEVPSDGDLTSEDEGTDASNEPPLAQYDSSAISALLATQQLTNEKVAQLQHDFDTKIAQNEFQEKIITQMHGELQQYKDDLYAKLVRPILVDVLQVRNAIIKMAESYQQKAEGEQDIPNKMFADYALDLQDILEKNDVEVYRSQAGDDFLAGKQHIVKTIATDDESFDRKVAQSFSSGYVFNGRVLSRENVAVYAYQKPAQPDNDNEVINHG